MLVIKMPQCGYMTHLAGIADLYKNICMMHSLFRCGFLNLMSYHKTFKLKLIVNIIWSDYFCAGQLVM